MSHTVTYSKLSNVLVKSCLCLKIKMNCSFLLSNFKVLVINRYFRLILCLSIDTSAWYFMIFDGVDVNDQTIIKGALSVNTFVPKQI